MVLEEMFFWIESYGVQAFWVGNTTAREIACNMANFYFGIE